MSQYNVAVGRVGYSLPCDDGSFSSACTISLVLGKYPIIFDPGSPWDRQLVLDLLSRNSLEAEKIAFVICSHGHVDHVGNINEFPNATIVVGTEIFKSNNQIHHNFKSYLPYIIDDQVEIIYTPGHSHNDVSLVIKNTKALGTVALVGDLFESEADLNDETLWKNISVDAALQDESRNRVLNIADHIIPGHGAIFKVPNNSI